MPVVLQTPHVPNAPAYDKVHLDHFTIVLEKTQYAKAQIQARVRLYYVDENGVKVFSDETKEISISDAEAWVLELDSQGNGRGVEAMEHIKAIVALLVETCTPYGAAGAA